MQENTPARLPDKPHRQPHWQFRRLHTILNIQLETVQSYFFSNVFLPGRKTEDIYFSVRNNWRTRPGKYSSSVMALARNNSNTESATGNSPQLRVCNCSCSYSPTNKVTAYMCNSDQRHYSAKSLAIIRSFAEYFVLPENEDFKIWVRNGQGF